MKPLILAGLLIISGGLLLCGAVDTSTASCDCVNVELHDVASGKLLTQDRFRVAIGLHMTKLRA